MLSTIQTRFTQALSPFSGDKEIALAAKHIIAGNNISSKQRLAIYSRNISGAHINTLKLIYPVCNTIIGDQSFSGLAEKYIWNTQNHSSDLNCYGYSFPSFLKDIVATTEGFHDYSYLSDLASLEWHFHQAYYQADDHQFDFKAFQKVCDQVSRINFLISHSVALMETEYPVLEIWEMHRAKIEIYSIDGISDKAYYCISRKNYAVEVTKINLTTYTLLAACQRGETISQLGELYPEEALKQLPNLIEQDWICGFILYD